MRWLVLTGAAVLLGLSAPAFAGSKEDKIAECMWHRMPQSADQFVRASTLQEETKGLVDGLAVCGSGNMSVNTRALKKRLEETRPAEVTANSEQPKTYICTATAEGKCEEDK